MIVSTVGNELIACDHCGIVALDTPLYGWKRWREDDLGDDGQVESTTYHHCPQAVQYNDFLSQGLVHGRAPDEAKPYDYWPMPNLFYLVHADNDYVDGPFVGRDDAIAERAKMIDPALSATVILNDGEYHQYRLHKEAQQHAD